ncbi:MAG: hypothetical protein H6624_06965 [Bdellovibrionaceae bacterium]|nr:hypothetical protein [Bdellovibrionales bacterium]MCB9084067.1 hypothetical protein [Pseudobdellovibrionaceae bacterium]
MFDLPLHPIIVHFPIVLGLFLPVVLVAILWLQKKGRAEKGSWWGAVVISFLFLASAIVANKTGEGDEDRVEKVVAHDIIHEHEEAAESLVVLAGVVFLLTVGATAWPKGGEHLKWVAVLGSLVAAAALVRTAHLGGELVYKHGAANAHVKGSGAGATPSLEREDHKDHEDKYEESEDHHD